MDNSNSIRLIDANALSQEIYELTDSYIDQDVSYPPHVVCNDISLIIEKAPNIDAVPLKYGEWIFGEFDGIGCPVKCSVCGFSKNHVDPQLWVEYPAHKFCGACGSIMTGRR